MLGGQGHKGSRIHPAQLLQIPGARQLLQGKPGLLCLGQGRVIHGKASDAAAAHRDGLGDIAAA